MAHEELKALYEIDKQHSVTPYQYWEFKHISVSGDWVNCFFEPAFHAGTEYRRKPGAPVWPVSDDAEDARKWRELDEYLPTALNANAVMGKITELKSGKPPLIQGYTAEQWQAIIDGKFLCEFSDDGGNEDHSVRISVLRELCPERFPFYSGFGSKWKYCRPLRIKGVRQPWFGGECPVDPNARVSYVLRDGYKDQTEAGRIRWEHKAVMSGIVEFIEL